MSNKKFKITVKESKKSEGLPPKRLGSERQYRSRADLINKMKQLGAVEITTSKQFNDIKNSQWLHTAGYAIDTNGNLVAQSYYGDKDGKWYYTSTRNFDSDYLPESKSDGERAVDDYGTLIDGLKELGFEPSSNVRNGKIYPYRARFTATKDGIMYGFTLNEDRTGEYLESIEVGGGIFDKGDPNDPDTTKFNSVGDLLDALKQVDGKKSEASRDFIPKTDIGRYDVHVFIYGENGRLLYRDDYSAATSTTYRQSVKDALDAYNSDRARVLQRSPEKADEWVEPYRVVILTAPDGENTERVYDAKLHWLKGEDWRKFGKQPESKKSESLSLKQKELKDMVRYGEAEDITTISDAEAKELRKKGIELVGVSRGTYGMNGALLRDNEGKKYAITARSSNLFYFV